MYATYATYGIIYTHIYIMYNKSSWIQFYSYGNVAAALVFSPLIVSLLKYKAFVTARWVDKSLILRN